MQMPLVPTPETQVQIRGKVSLLRQCVDAKDSLAIMAMVIAMTCVLVPFLPMLYFWAGAAYPLLCFILGCLGGVCAVGCLVVHSRLAHGRIRSLHKIEERISTGQSLDPQADIESMLQLSVDLKRIEVADFLSRLLLQTATNGELLDNIRHPISSTKCWASTAAYTRSWRYKFVWLYESIGTLSLLPNVLCYQSAKIHFNVRLEDIVSIERGRYPRSQKPISMYFIRLKFMEEGELHELCLTPVDANVTVFEVNKSVKVWMEKIEQARAVHKAESDKQWERLQRSHDVA